MRPDRGSEVLRTGFVAGGCSAFVVLGLEQGLLMLLRPEQYPPLLRAALELSVVAALPEECAKLAVLLGIAVRNVDVRRFADVLLAALAVAAGFAAVENALYLAGAKAWAPVALLRTFTAVPAHGLFGMAMGSFLVLAKLSELRGRYGFCTAALIAPVTLHAAYDFPLFAVRADRGLVWLLQVWTVIFCLSALFVVVLLNVALRTGERRDQLAGRVAPPSRAWPSCLLGLVAVLLGTLPVGATLASHAPIAPSAWVFASLGIVPFGLGLDLIGASVHRQRGCRWRSLPDPREHCVNAVTRAGSSG